MIVREAIRAGFSRERIGIWLLGLLVVGVALLIGFAGTPYTAPAGTVDRVAASPDVSVTQAAGGYAITPAETTAETGLVFYPGARVDPSAYVSVMAPVVASTDIAIFVPRPRLNLAVFEPGMAGSVMDANPEIDQWYVGGHSLGGAMACRYASANSNGVDGLVLFGSYCDRSIAETDLAVLTVGGTKDTVLGTDRAALRPGQLPETAQIHRIDGLNHTQFGSYSGQPGDRKATISRETAHDRLQAALVDFLGRQ